MIDQENEELSRSLTQQGRRGTRVTSENRRGTFNKSLRWSEPVIDFENLEPGPQTYEITYADQITTKKGIIQSTAERPIHKKMVEESPGPLTYKVNSYTKKRPISYSIGRKKKVLSNQQQSHMVNPGPGYYYFEDQIQEGWSKGASIGFSKRRSSEPSTQTPGSESYEVGSSLRRKIRGGVIKQARRFTSQRYDNELGPGEYSFENYGNKKKEGVTMAKAKRYFSKRK